MNQYIVCRVANQHFTVSISATNRIIPLSEVTHVPDTMAYLMGVIESEGEILPIIDLSKRFFDHSIKDKKDSQVIIVYWKGLDIGLAVDEVLTIKEYDDSQVDYDLEKITTLDQDSDKSPIKSFIRSDQGLILELDVENLFEMKDTVKIQALFDFQEEEETVVESK